MPLPAPLASLRARYERARQKRWFRWTFDLSIFLAIVLAIGAWQTRRHLSGVEVPAATLPTLNGAPVSLASLKGKPTLIMFWAPWCGVCRQESQNVSWARGLVGERANVLSIVASYEDLDSVQRFVTERAVDYPVLLGDDGLVQQFRVEAYPTVYFLDADGRIKRSAAGYTTTIGLLARLFL